MRKLKETNALAKIFRRTILPMLAMMFAASPLCAQNGGLDREVTLSGTHITLGKTMAEIQDQTPYRFAFNPDQIDTGAAVVLPQNAMTIRAVLDLLAGTGKYKYVVRDHFIAISSGVEVLPGPPSVATAPSNTVAGVLRRQSAPERVSLTEKYTVKSVSLGTGQNERTVSSFVAPVFYSSSGTSHIPSLAIKTNFLYDATLTPNLGVEFSIGHKSTIDISGGYNFYDPSSGKQWQHWLVQPEYRWWFCERFNGAFIGGHLLGGQFNFSGIDFPFNVFSDLKDNRYEGEFYGIGAVFGYQWILGKRWSLEMAIGAGYVRVEYDKFGCNTCGPALISGSKNYFGPTKASVSLLFFL